MRCTTHRADHDVASHCAVEQLNCCIIISCNAPGGLSPGPSHARELQCTVWKPLIESLLSSMMPPAVLGEKVSKSETVSESSKSTVPPNQICHIRHLKVWMTELPLYNSIPENDISLIFVLQTSTGASLLEILGKPLTEMPMVPVA